MGEEQRIAHLRGASSLGPKCGASEAAVVTNWVVGATYHEVYVPADVLHRAERICERCQDAALADESGSDDEVFEETERAGGADRAPGELAEADTEIERLTGDVDPELVEISDDRLLRELERRLGDERKLAEEKRDKAENDRG